MSRTLLFILAGALATAALPTGTTADTPGVFLLKSVGDDGFAYVGTPVEFGYVILNDAGAPATHTTAAMTVVQNGVVLYETTDVSSHDYDGVNTFLIAFPTTGPYSVHVETAGDGALHFEGYVLPRRDDVTPQLAVTPPAEVVEGQPARFELAVTDPAGEAVAHRDVLLEIRRPSDEWLIFRTILHQHEEPTAFEYVFPESGSYLMRAVAYTSNPREDRPHMEPVATTLQVDVADAGPAQLPPGARTAPAAAPAGPYEVLTAVDPQNENTPFSRYVASAIAYDPEAGAAVPHVNYAVEVFETTTGWPIFKSDGLHAYDGQQELVMNLPYPGRYVFVATASLKDGSWQATAVREFTVASTAPLATSWGAVIADATGLDDLKAGVPTDITFSTTNVLGQPAQHAEIDFHVVREDWGVPLIQNKLHSHGEGIQPIRLTLPEAGEYTLIVNPVTIHGEPTPQYYWREIGGSLVVPITVADGPGLPANLPADADGLDPEDVAQAPGAGGLLAVLAAAGAVVVARRRR